MREEAECVERNRMVLVVWGDCDMEDHCLALAAVTVVWPSNNAKFMLCCTLVLHGNNSRSKS